MKDRFYGDKKDLVKWGGIVHLCHEKGIKTVVQVAYYRKDAWSNKIDNFDGQSVGLPDAVMKHFRRNIYDIKRLGNPADLNIRVIDEEIDNKFGDGDRKRYCVEVCEKIRGIKEGKMIFLDPDNGLEPENCRPEHAKIKEVNQIWNSLNQGDFLVFYQHKPRDSNEHWKAECRDDFARKCGLKGVRMWSADGIAKDVMFYFVER